MEFAKPRNHAAASAKGFAILSVCGRAVDGSGSWGLRNLSIVDNSEPADRTRIGSFPSQHPPRRDDFDLAGSARHGSVAEADFPRPETREGPVQPAPDGTDGTASAAI